MVSNQFGMRMKEKQCLSTRSLVMQNENQASCCENYRQDFGPHSSADGSCPLFLSSSSLSFFFSFISYHKNIKAQFGRPTFDLVIFFFLMQCMFVHDLAAESDSSCV